MVRKVDPVYGYEVDKFEGDHIVSMKEITEALSRAKTLGFTYTDKGNDSS